MLATFSVLCFFLMYMFAHAYVLDRLLKDTAQSTKYSHPIQR
uniref:Uncharacterized protein n=1 Tax=Desertifilum tharense IPPAS B-1220 TaxID=1781255 RepID=A0ACD5GZG0_9CYAN|nr:hypothetical protein [Desertifilum tharense]